MTKKQKTMTISEAAESLGYRPRTLREWERTSVLPDYLYPARDKNGNRVYTDELVEHIREWLVAEDPRARSLAPLRRGNS